MDHLRSWTENEETRFYSGVAIYQKDVDVPTSFLATRAKIFLDFGPGTAVEPGSAETIGMRALLESPVRESAVVSVSGQRAGTVWHPPYELDVTQYLRRRRNTSARDGRAIWRPNKWPAPVAGLPIANLHYGERFVPQDMQDVKPLPSGIVGTVRLVSGGSAGSRSQTRSSKSSSPIERRSSSGVTPSAPARPGRVAGEWWTQGE